MKVLNFRKIVSLAIATTMLLTAGISSFAIDSQSAVQNTVSGSKVVNDEYSKTNKLVAKNNEKIVGVYKKVGNKLIKVSDEEISSSLSKSNLGLKTSSELEKTDGNKIFTQAAATQVAYVYKYVNVSNKGYVLMSNEAKIMCNPICNTSRSPMKRTLTGKTIVTWSFSTSLAVGKKDAILGTVGGNYLSTAEHTETLEMTIQPGEKQWLEFVPMKNKFVGNLETRFVTYKPGTWPWSNPIEISNKLTGTEYSYCAYAPLAIQGQNGTEAYGYIYVKSGKV